MHISFYINIKRECLFLNHKCNLDKMLKFQQFWAGSQIQRGHSSVFRVDSKSQPAKWSGVGVISWIWPRRDMWFERNPSASHLACASSWNGTDIWLQFNVKYTTYWHWTISAASYWYNGESICVSEWNKLRRCGSIVCSLPSYSIRYELWNFALQSSIYQIFVRVGSHLPTFCNLFVSLLIQVFHFVECSLRAKRLEQLHRLPNRCSM